MILANARLESDGWRSIRRTSWSWAVWAIANGIWITGEHLGSLQTWARVCLPSRISVQTNRIVARLMYPGEEQFNYVVAALLTTAFVMLASSYEQYKEQHHSLVIYWASWRWSVVKVVSMNRVVDI